MPEIWFRTAIHSLTPRARDRLRGLDERLSVH
jgi:hypothetical protein